MLEFYEHKLFCPFCGQKVLDFENPDHPVTPCTHTLFSASDAGFEYRSERFDKLVADQGIADEEDEDGFNGYDNMTDQLQVTDGVKFAQYVGPPGDMGGYLGFAPIEEE
ncbi:hypothetical protein ABC383_17790 [Noviherbaspirillum sp. 1P10PC]|uniref:hypothetical protein n=1 Tax=Noviherbaspirillum sp. 1P10PC TaxID=3132292 RepID=UPI0039A29E01